jgi:hypothetical protein
MKNLYLNEEKQYCFEHEGIEIVNPIMSPDFRGQISPEYYGFTVWHTGGGCTAHGQEFNHDFKTVVMLLTDGELNHVSDETLEATGGLYDYELNECFKELTFIRN